MKVLVIGNGGREHALCMFIKKSPICKKLYCIPGSDSIKELADCFDINPMNNIDVVNFCIKQKIDFVVIGPELPLSNGIVDQLKKEKIISFGPDKISSQLETSKIFMKNICKKHNIPTAKYSIFNKEKDAINFLNEKCSSDTKMIDNGKTSRGTIAIHIPANPLDTYCWPQLNKEKGIAFENNPIPKQWSQIFCPSFVDSVGNLSPIINASDVTQIAAIKILTAANIKGEKLSKA